MRIWNYIYIFLLLILSLVIIALFQLPDQNLHVIACDVGQGDAILTTYKNIQILTDGGPDNSVLNCLGKHMPFWDRKIELVISTHPDSDHSTGLVEVLKRYKVVKMLVNPLDPGTPVYGLLQGQAQSKKIEIVNPVNDMSIVVDLIRLDIVNPTGDMLNGLVVKNIESRMSKYSIGKETNLYSIVYSLSFKSFNGLFLGDIPPDVSDRLAVQLSNHPYNYIKVPHHGSTNGLTQNLLEKTNLQVATISVGKKNLWGFPSAAILQMLRDQDIKILRTDEMGDVEVVTDGEKYWVKN